MIRNLFSTSPRKSITDNNVSSGLFIRHSDSFSNEGVQVLSESSSGKPLLLFAFSEPKSFARAKLESTHQTTILNLTHLRRQDVEVFAVVRDQHRWDFFRGDGFTHQGAGVGAEVGIQRREGLI